MAANGLRQANTRVLSTITCLAPATAGEIIQGTMDQMDYLVNFPINLFSKVQVSLSTAFKGIRVCHPTKYSKSVAAVSQLLDLAGTNKGLELRFLSNVPRGKGLASSSSEIAAALEAAATLLDYKLSGAASCLINAKVEATDCVQVEGISLVYQLKGHIISSFPAPANISVIMVDCGGHIATDEFDREKFHYVGKKFHTAHKKARQLLMCGLSENCSHKIGMAATLSASINQNVIYKEQFPALLSLAQGEGGLGVNCAHSGTILGLMYDPRRVQEKSLFSKMQQMFGQENVFSPHRLISGGVHAQCH